MIACFLSNISAKYYKNPSMLSRVIAKNVGDVFFETQCSSNCFIFHFDGARVGRWHLYRRGGIGSCLPLKATKCQNTVHYRSICLM